jgi:predicted aspartyl protease
MISTSILVVPDNRISSIFMTEAYSMIPFSKICSSVNGHFYFFGFVNGPAVKMVVKIFLQQTIFFFLG